MNGKLCNNWYIASDFLYMRPALVSFLLKYLQSTPEYFSAYMHIIIRTFHASWQFYCHNNWNYWNRDPTPNCQEEIVNIAPQGDRLYCRFLASNMKWKNRFSVFWCPSCFYTGFPNYSLFFLPISLLVYPSFFRESNWQKNKKIKQHFFTLNDSL